MEQAVEARLEQDKAIIQGVTQQEMRRAQLRNKIAALRNSRSVLTPESQALDAKGKPIPGRRKFQNYYVTKDQVMNRVMKRLNLPKDELADLEEDEPTSAEDKPLETPETPETPADADSDECLMVGEDEDNTVPVTELPILFKAKELPSKPVVTVKTKPQVVAPKRVKKMDEIDRALAEIAKQDRRAADKAAKRKARAKNI